jgi:hypothetical protein
MTPPWWMHAVAIVGAVVQLAGCVTLVRKTEWRGALFRMRVTRWLSAIVAAVFLLKLTLQLIAGWPAVAALATQRMVVIGFLHLVFLAVVTPLILALAIELGWMRLRASGYIGLFLLGSGTLVTETILFTQPATGFFSWLPVLPNVHHWLAMAGAIMLAGIALLFTAFASGPPPVPRDAGHIDR